MPELRGHITKDKDWKKIAQHQKEKFFVDSEETRKEDLQRISSIYNYDVLGRAC